MDQHLVEAGRVWCPLRGDADVESCLRCPHQRKIDLGVQGLVVDCRPPLRSVADGVVLSRI